MYTNIIGFTVIGKLKIRCGLLWRFLIIGLTERTKETMYMFCSFVGPGLSPKLCMFRFRTERSRHLKYIINVVASLQ